MPFDPDKVPDQYGELFYHGKPDEDGNPVGLTDEQWNQQKQELVEMGIYPFPLHKSEE